MTFLKLATLSLALLAVPATAQSLSDTHTMRWAPSGKVPSVTYHPIKRDCQPSAPIHLSGKTHYMGAPDRAPACATNLAKAERNRAEKVIVQKD